MSRLTGLLDIDGIEIKEGDTVMKQYIDPVGRLHDELDSDSRATVTWEHGAFVVRRGRIWYCIQEYCKREEGEYISNYGTEIVLSNQTILKVVSSVEVEV